MRRFFANIGAALVLAITWLTAEGHPEHLPRVSEASLRAGHEVTDASAQLLKYLAIGLIGSGIILQAFMIWMFFDLRGHFSGKRPPESALVQRHELPPPPRLQIDPRADLDLLKLQNQEVLNSYGWVDRKQGIVRIPIERAIERVANGK